MAAVPSRADGMFHVHSPVGTMTNALRRGGPPCPPAPGGFIVCHQMFWLHGVSGFGLQQDDRDDYQHPPGAWFPQSREWDVLSCVRLVDSPGRLCLRPPPNTPLRHRDVCYFGCLVKNPRCSPRRVWFQILCVGVGRRVRPLPSNTRIH